MITAMTSHAAGLPRGRPADTDADGDHDGGVGAVDVDRPAFQNRSSSALPHRLAETLDAAGQAVKAGPDSNGDQDEHAGADAHEDTGMPGHDVACVAAARVRRT